MSINISAAQQRHSKHIHITYDLTTFGPRQRTAMLRAMRTGMLKGNSVGNDIAKTLRSNHDLGTIEFRTWCIRWANLTPDNFDPITVALATCKLEGISTNRGGTNEVESKAPRGSVYIGGSKPPNMSLGACPELESFAADIESGKVTELTLPI